jgi:hypothetical protein
MSEVEETGPVSVDDVLQAIQQKNLAQAKAHFTDIMGVKINDALENEKVRMANQVYNPHAEEEVEEEPEEDFEDETEEVESELADVEETEKEVEEETDSELEVEAAFEEEWVEEE